MNPKVTGVCTKCGAEGKIRSNGLCVKHYAEDWREKTRATPCKIEGCDRGCKSRMLCDRHYSQYIRSQKSKSARRMASLVIANEEKNRIVLLLRKYGHHQAADLVAVSTSLSTFGS
jgi:hypothetical protein